MSLLLVPIVFANGQWWGVYIMGIALPAIIVQGIIMTINFFLVKINRFRNNIFKWVNLVLVFLIIIVYALGFYDGIKALDRYFTVLFLIILIILTIVILLTILFGVHLFKNPENYNSSYLSNLSLMTATISIVILSVYLLIINRRITIFK